MGGWFSKKQAPGDAMDTNQVLVCDKLVDTNQAHTRVCDKLIDTAETNPPPMKAQLDVDRDLEMRLEALETHSRRAHLRFQLLETTSHNGIMVWKINKYNQHKQDTLSGCTLSLYSPPFYTSGFGYKMCLRAYLVGTVRVKAPTSLCFLLSCAVNMTRCYPGPSCER